jgi:hypothetical protein
MITKQRNQVVLANVCILAGIAFQYYRGFPLLHLAITGILILAAVNLIFFVRAQKTKKPQ